MKLILSGLVLALLAVPFLAAQQVEPTSLTFEAVPGYTSPAQSAKFENTGASDLALTISISGPFGMPRNECRQELKPGTRCNVYVTYTPESVETDTGTLTFTFNQQSVSVSLTGDGVAAIPTHTALHAPGRGKVGVEYEFTVKVTPLKVPGWHGYAVPNGEQAYVNCEDNRGGGLHFSVTLEKGLGSGSHAFGAAGEWACGASYNGDQEYGASSIELHNDILITE